MASSKNSVQCDPEKTFTTIVPQKHWLYRFCRALRDTFFEYTRATKVNGVWMLRENRTKGAARYAWSNLLFGLLFLGSYLAFQLWLKFYSYPILNTISTDLSIIDVAFPGITICSPKVVNFDKVQKYVKTLKLPPDVKATDVAQGFDYINAYTDQNWVPHKYGFEATEKWLMVNNITIYEAALEVSAGCDDFFHLCYWGGKEFPCKQDHEYLSFVPSTSYLGPCCSFNYNPKNESYVPFSTNIFGMDGGLSFIGREGSEKNLSTGLIVLIHHPKDYTTETAASVTIASKSESFVEVIPTYQSSSIEVLELDEKKRNCLTSDDVSLKNYRQAACLVSCQRKAIFKACRCYPYHLPTESNQHIDNECKLKDAACYSANFDNFKNPKCEHCLPNCFDVTYETLSYYTDLRQHNFSISGLYKRNELLDGFILRVYMAKQAVPSVHKVTVMSWISLLSDLGGVFNLCLGLSAISLVEFIYFFTYILHRNYTLNSVLTTNLAIGK